MREFSTEFPDGTLTRWRPLTWGEYRRLRDQFKDSEGPTIWLLHDAVVGLCLTDFESPGVEDYDDLAAGTIGSLGELILTETGFVAQKELVEKKLNAARQRINENYYYSAVSIICAAFRYRPNEVDDLTLDEFMDLLVMAEKALATDINIHDPDEQPMVEVPGPDGKPIRVPVNTARSMRQKNRIPDIGERAQKSRRA